LLFNTKERETKTGSLYAIVRYFWLALGVVEYPLARLKFQQTPPFQQWLTELRAHPSKISETLPKYTYFQKSKKYNPLINLFIINYLILDILLIK
jgi:hypothetical protein